MDEQKPITPSHSGESVNCNTSHCWPSTCIQLPVWETIIPTQYRR